VSEQVKRTPESMAKWHVRLPITGVVDVEVYADSEKEAIQAAIQQASLEEIAEWEAHEQVCEGNVVYGSLSRAVADQIEED
jgi:hypothetical protein